MIEAGFCVADITPAIGASIPGGFAPRISTGVEDPLQVRAVVVTSDAGTIAIVGVDAVSLRFDTVAEAREQIRAACGIPEGNVLIAANHTHSGGPANDILGTDSDDGYCAYVASQIAACVKGAHSRRVSAEVAWASGRCEELAFNRRFKMRDGREATNPGKNNPDKVAPAGPVDPEVGIIAFRSDKERLLGMVGNFTCHATVVGGSKFSGDYSAYWQRALRALAGAEFTLVFLNGACGDISQVDHTNPACAETGVGWAERMGSVLAEESLRAIRRAEFVKKADLRSTDGAVMVRYRRPTAVQLTEAQSLCKSDAPWDSKKWLARDVVLLAERIGEAEGVECPVQAIRIGQAAVVAAPWQPFCEFGLKVKAASPFHPTLIGAFANGMLGYVPTPQGFDGGGYEPTLCRGSKLQPNAGNLIADEMVRLLRSV